MNNLENIIKEDLWNEIKNTYESKQYTESIKNAIIYLSDCIRDKSGLESDGVNLINQAFNLKNPIIKVNKLQTKTEKSIQEGVLQFLNGIYKFIRNPRNHEKYIDTKKDAYSIIITINYILITIEKAQANFEVNYFIKNRIFDNAFVKTDRYAELLIKEIPSNKKYILINELLFNSLYETNLTNAQLIITKILHDLNDTEKNDLINSISTELETTEDVILIKKIIMTLPLDIIESIEEISKYRLQNFIIEDIKQGQINNNHHLHGELGTLIKYFDNRFLLKEQLFTTVLQLLIKNNNNTLAYLFKYIIPCLINIDDINADSPIITIIQNRINEGDTQYYNFVFEWIISQPQLKELFISCMDKYESDLKELEEDLPF